MADVPFVEFQKIARLSRLAVVTEKIDGTNAQIHITEAGEMLVGSRTRWITPQSDNYGFAAWAEAHRSELLALGPGSHFGEWWGQGIQRRYGLTEKRFSLFNVGRWMDSRSNEWPDKYDRSKLVMAPACCHVVPVLYAGPFTTDGIDGTLDDLRRVGSVAAPGFRNPEGVVIYHPASRALFKKTLEKDEEPKSLRGAA
jgi:hypothetical protein